MTDTKRVIITGLRSRIEEDHLVGGRSCLAVKSAALLAVFGEFLIASYGVAPKRDRVK